MVYKILVRRRDDSFVVIAFLLKRLVVFCGGYKVLLLLRRSVVHCRGHEILLLLRRSVVHCRGNILLLVATLRAVHVLLLASVVVSNLLDGGLIDYLLGIDHTATAAAATPLVTATVFVTTFVAVVPAAVLSSAVIIASTSFWMVEVVASGPVVNVGLIPGDASALALAVILPRRAFRMVSVMAPSRLFTEGAESRSDAPVTILDNRKKIVSSNQNNLNH